jgi:acetyl-CoA carboxylase biotin carboxylase subunit
VFKKILIANRGEIALRVIRACREMGITSVAVYSDADARAPHVREADEAAHIGAPPSAESYLKGDRIIEVAQRLGRRSNSSWLRISLRARVFARAVRDAGLTFIGPPAEAIAAMGSKTRRAQLAIEGEVPVVPGTTEPLTDAAEAREIAERFGYPVLLKAAAGGGGKGMRVVASGRDRDASTRRAARRRTRSATTPSTSRSTSSARARRDQVLGDSTAHALAHRARVLRAAPASEDDRGGAERRGDAGDRAGDGRDGACAPRGGGLRQRRHVRVPARQDGKFYFLEMNTRLQVEHPVTELVTGIDSVQWQIRIARGERLPFKQEEIVPRGWAIECRITSEDPANGFLPSTGACRICICRPVPAFVGMADRSRERCRLFYDPMLAKLIVHAATREAAIERMHARCSSSRSKASSVARFSSCA